MSEQIDDNSSEMDILSGEKNNPPHTQQSQMATEFTSSAMKKNTLSKVTSPSSAIGIPARPTDGVTNSSGLHDESIVSPLSSSCPNNSNTSTAALAGQPVKNKRKHRRGKPKTKNTKPYKKANWKFQVPRYGRSQSGVYVAATGSNSNSNSSNGRRAKLNRSRSLVPYNTNKFLMEEHMADVPSFLLTPSARTRDSSFSVDSEDNYFYSLPEDEEEFLTKEFANVYERARVERLEALTKQQLIEECLQIEDRYSEQGVQRQQQVSVQKVSADFISKIRLMEEKIRDLTRENYELRRQLAISAATATAMTQNPTPMDSSSEDSESDSSSSSSSSNSSSSSESSLSEYSATGEPNLDDNEMLVDDANAKDGKVTRIRAKQRNGYHSAESNTPSSSPSRLTSPESSSQQQQQQQSQQQEPPPRLPEASNTETAEMENSSSI